MPCRHLIWGNGIFNSAFNISPLATVPHGASVPQSKSTEPKSMIVIMPTGQIRVTAGGRHTPADFEIVVILFKICCLDPSSLSCLPESPKHHMKISKCATVRRS
jgi:hypothetical protein